jgi:hypothetical protein
MDNEIRQRLRAALQSWLDRSSLIHDEDARDDEDGARAALVELAEDDDISQCCRLLDLAPPLCRVEGRRFTPMGDGLSEPEPDSWSFNLPGRTVPSAIQSPKVARRYRAVFELAWNAVVPEWVKYLAPMVLTARDLPPDAVAFLRAMVALGAVEGRKGQDELWALVEEKLHEAVPKTRREAAIRILKERDLIDSKAGTGTMLTPAGRGLVRSASFPSNPE